MTLDLAAAVHRVGRGRDGARALTRTEAAALFGAMLDDAVPPLELGALLIAYRIKGESVDELRGFLDAAEARLARVAVPPSRPAVVIPTYNGARHLPNLVPLLAIALRDAGIAVLVHGVREDPRRVTTASILAVLGIAPSATADAAGDALARDGLAFAPIDAIAPGLARLLGLRARLGVRSSAHTIVKMLNPIGPHALQLVSVTHPEYLAAMRAFYATYPSDVLLLRGTEGEAVANARRPQAIERLHAGAPDTLVAALEGSLATLPELPASRDAAVTAHWIEAVRAGDAPMPPAIAAQVDALRRVCAARAQPLTAAA